MRKTKLFKRISAFVLASAFVCGSIYSASASKTGSSPSAQILYGSTYTGTEQRLRDAFSSATSGFSSTFDITFTLSSVNSSTALNRPRNCSDVCSTFCCGSSNCDSSHSNGGMRILRKMSSNSTFRIGVVGHVLCYGTGGKHARIAGIAEFPGESRRTVITTEVGFTLKYLMQHELSHNLGVRTHCSSQCVMNEDNTYVDKWCTTHSNDIKNNK